MNYVIIGGLVLDVLGALIIIVPDIPQANRELPTGKARRGLEILETKALGDDSPGFKHLVTEIEDLTEKSIPEDTMAIAAINYKRTIGGTGSPRALIPLQPGDDPDEGLEQWSEFEEWKEVDFNNLRYPLERRIRQEEARIRAIGFGFLATGFLLQIIGNI